jgi:Holliday junction resolvase
MRVRELRDPDVFDSFVAELEVADVLALNGWTVEFLSSKSSNGVKPPDMIARRASGNLAVEVKMLTDDQVFHRMEKGLRKILGDSGFSARVTLGPDIAQADKFHRTRFIELMLKDFERQFDNMSQSQQIATPFGHIRLWKRSPGQECEILFGTTIIGIPRGLFRERIKSDILDAAQKRGTWNGELAGYPFLVALVAKEHWTGPEDVEHVASGGEGLFLVDETCRNITGIMSVAITGQVTVLPNPRSYVDISEPTLATQITRGL